MKKKGKLAGVLLYPHLWKTGKDEHPRILRRVSPCVSSVYALLASQHGCRCQSSVGGCFQHLPARCFLDCNNQSDLKLWLMLILSRHGGPIFLSLSGRYGFVVVQIAGVVADHPRATT